MKKTILFFGGSGFIGTYFVKKLLSLGHKVKVFDLKKPLIYHKNLSYIKGNILDKKKISKIIKKDYFVFNFAGWADLESAINNPREVIRQNVLGNSAIMDICKKKRVKLLNKSNY